MRLIVSIFCCLLYANSFVYADEHDHSGFNWKELRMACKGDHESDQCQAMRAEAREFCQAHPDKKRCRKLQVMKACRDNPESEKCIEHKEKLKAYCAEHPGAKKCVRARLHRICKQDPESAECLEAKDKAHKHFCEKHPQHEKCT